MKIFDKPQGHINFIDKNENFVGFDMWSSCCEEFGWSFSYELPLNFDDAKKEDITVENQDLEDYEFDIDFFHETSEGADAGGVVTFKMVKSDGPDIYLSFYNSHNGYYSHGFNGKIGGKVIDGNL